MLVLLRTRLQAALAIVVITFPLVNRIQETLAGSLTCQEPVEPCKQVSLEEGYFCDHCNRYLCKKKTTFKTHQRLYFNKESNSWLKHYPFHPDFKDSESSEDYSDLDEFENNSHLSDEAPPLFDLFKEEVFEDAMSELPVDECGKLFEMVLKRK